VTFWDALSENARRCLGAYRVSSNGAISNPSVSIPPRKIDRTVEVSDELRHTVDPIVHLGAPTFAPN